MVVEDELPAREILRAFPWETYSCVLAAEAGHGEEALALIGEVKPDIIITDVMMPVLDGLSLVRALKRDYPSIRIILLTCYGDYPYVREALQLGVVDYMLKGIYREEELGRALLKADSQMEKDAQLARQLAVIRNDSTSRELRIEIEQAMALVDKRLNEDFSAVEIAESVGLSPKYFGILFKKQTGELFQDYVKRVRMEQAAHLLKHTGLKVYEVADQVGYPNYRYFTEVFNKHFGKTPKEMKGIGHVEA
jgi:two-component system response regulator YesN